jgi:hypothetical protein
MARPTVFFFISPTARIGMSMLVRVVADFFILHQNDFHGFDTNINNPRLVQRFAQTFQKVDLATISGQMQLLDSILDHAHKNALVDVWSPLLPQLMTLLTETHFITEAEQRGMDVVFMLGINDHVSAAAVARQIRHIAGNVQIVGIINEGVSAFGYEASDVMSSRPIDQTFEVGSLDHITLRAIEAEHFSFTRFFMTPPTHMSIVVKAQVKQWLTRNFTQLRTFEMRRSLLHNEFLK